MGNTYDRVAHRYFGRIVGDTTRDNLYNPRMPIVRLNGEEVICSYGSHFPLALPLRDKKRKANGFLLNGDRWGNTTSGHQSVIRTAVAGTGLPSVIIPFSALTQAGIDTTTVQILEVTKDRTETIPVVTYEEPDGAVWGEVEVVDEYGEWAELDGDGNRWKPRFRNVDYRTPYRGMGRYNNSIVRDMREALQRGDQKRRGYHLGYLGRITHREARLFLSKRDAEGGYGRHWEVEPQPDGRTKYSRTYYRHWLGESLISAEVAWTERRTCRTCGGFGRGPWTHTGSGRCLTCGWGDGVEVVTRRRRTKFLSGFDANETRPSYFFAEMPPKCKATTIEEAYAALKPDAVQLAEQMGRDVRRQGDIFAIPTDFDKRTLRKMGARIAKQGRLFNTNHQATEVAVLPDGTTLARGTLRHVPLDRRPDHKRVSLDKTRYFLMVKNTVPVAATR